MSNNNNQKLEDQKLKYFWVWLLIGCLYLGWMIYETLSFTPVQIKIDDFDKVMHFAAYAFLMIWFAWIFYKQSSRYLMVVLFVSLGVGLEFAQEAGGVRYFEYGDMIANTLGVLAGYFVTRGCGRFHLIRIEQRLIEKKLEKRA